MINLWSQEPVSVAQLMGDAPPDDFANDEEGLLAEAAQMEADADARRAAAEGGWDDVPGLPEMLEDE